MEFGRVVVAFEGAKVELGPVGGERVVVVFKGTAVELGPTGGARVLVVFKGAAVVFGKGIGVGGGVKLGPQSP